jgi:xylose isomerase
MARIKNSVGIWAFQEMPTRFLGAGYHPEFEGTDMVERTKMVVDGLGDIVDGFEYHYPGEINEKTADRIVTALGADHDVYCIASGLHTDSAHAKGAFTNPDPAVRANAIALSRAAVDLAAELGSHFIIWPGIEGYNYPFQCDYQQVWDWFLAGLGETIQHAADRGVTVFLEHKNSEPAMKVLMRNIGMALWVIQRLDERGVDVSRLKLNMDWQHLIMNGEHLAEYAAILADEDLLGHQHANSGWGMFDDDNMVGTTYFMSTLEVAQVLQQVGYGARGERIGYDLFPYTEDPIEAVRQSVLQWEFIWELAQKVDPVALATARRNKDAVGGYQAVYAALGLDESYVERALSSRRSE